MHPHPQTEGIVICCFNIGSAYVLLYVTIFITLNRILKISIITYRYVLFSSNSSTDDKPQWFLSANDALIIRELRDRRRQMFSFRSFLSTMIRFFSSKKSVNLAQDSKGNFLSSLIVQSRGLS